MRWGWLWATLNTSEDPAIDWTGLERRTYSVRLLYKEVEAPPSKSHSAPVAPRAPAVEGGNPACWLWPYRAWAAVDLPQLIAAAENVSVQSEVLETEEEGTGAEERYHLTHAELLDRARALESEIRRHLTEAQSIVAVCLQRTPALVVALVGILFAGAAYLPLEPTHPGARLRLLLEDSKAVCLVTCWCARRRNLLPEERLVRITAIDGKLMRASPEKLAPAEPEEPCTLEDAAYLMLLAQK
eukprot:g4320.t1